MITQNIRYAALNQGVHYDVVYLVENHLEELPKEYHPWLLRMAEAARGNIQTGKNAHRDIKAAQAMENAS